MAINSKVILCRGISIDRNYTNVLDYNETQMLQLCNSNKVAERTNYSFVKESNNTISTDFTYSDALKSNYIAFQNQRYDNKWFFAWIDKVEYINDGVTRISFTVDYWSTWFGYWSIRPCFTIREHVADDTIGANTVDEDLDVGRVESILTTEYDLNASSSCYIVIASNYNPKTNPTWWDKTLADQTYSGITIHNNLVSGHQYYVFEIRSGYESTDYFNVLLFLIETNKDGYIDEIKDMFIIPKDGIDSTTLISNDFSVVIGSNTYTCTNYKLPFSYSPKTGVWNVAKVTSFSDLTNIQNNKCYCYPYNYLYVTNNTGSKNIYKYEDFSDSSDATFSSEFAVCIGGSGRIVPTNYKGVGVNYDESLSLGKYPVCGWTADSFTNWLTQNAVNLATSFISTGVKTGAAIGTGIGTVTGSELATNVSSGIGEGVSGQGVLPLIGSFYQASLLPNIEGGQNNGDINYSAGSTSFKFMRMRAKPEYMRIIDNWFSKYGYKVNKLKIPEISSRTNWNYVQIGSQDIIGIPSITKNSVLYTTPEVAFTTINNIMRKGVTIWHNHANVGNYNLTNPIVTP